MSSHASVPLAKVPEHELFAAAHEPELFVPRSTPYVTSAFSPAVFAGLCTAVHEMCASPFEGLLAVTVGLANVSVAAFPAPIPFAVMYAHAETASATTMKALATKVVTRRRALIWLPSPHTKG